MFEWSVLWEDLVRVCVPSYISCQNFRSREKKPEEARKHEGSFEQNFCWGLFFYLFFNLHFKSQLLRFLEIIIHDEFFHPVWVQVVPHNFRPTELKTSKTKWQLIIPVAVSTNCEADQFFLLFRVMVRIRVRYLFPSVWSKFLDEQNADRIRFGEDVHVDKFSAKEIGKCNLYLQKHHRTVFQRKHFWAAVNKTTLCKLHCTNFACFCANFPLSSHFTDDCVCGLALPMMNRLSPSPSLAF